MAGGEQPAGHANAHLPEPDESDFCHPAAPFPQRQNSERTTGVRRRPIPGALGASTENDDQISNGSRRNL
jgi:hypothetical protein